VRLEDLIFVTSNSGKLREAQEVLGVQLENVNLDLPEIQSLDLTEVVRHKARTAHERLGRPVLVEDTSLEIRGLEGFPGPLVRWLLVSVGAAGIGRLAAAFGDARALARCLACAFGDGLEVVGEGEIPGLIVATPRGRQGFGWDPVFAPEGGGGRTFAEMAPVEKNRVSHRRLAFEALRERLAQP
jgi:non-canonical purine NTP pyrophosphatase (RdgB/HAM1 family)